MNTLLSDCGLVDARINASEKDLSVPQLKSVTLSSEPPDPPALP